MASTITSGKIDKMTDEQLVANIRELVEKYKHVFFDAIAMDTGTWRRVANVVTLQHYSVNMSGDHFLFKKKVLFTARPGVQLLFHAPTQAEIKL